MARPLDMDRSKYRNPDMPVGYVKQEPELRYTHGREIDGVHYIWAPYIYDAHIDERDDYDTLSDLIITSDEECTIEATVNGHESDTSTLGATFSQIDIEEKGARRKKKIKIKKERRRSGSSSSSSSRRHASPVSSRKHTSPSRRKHGSPSSHRHRSPSPVGRRHHSPSSHRHRSTSPSRPSSSKRHYSPSSRDKIVPYSPSQSPERYMDVKVKQEYIKQEYYDVKIKEEPLEPPEHLHGSYHCSTCNVNMNSLLTYNTHLNGKRHRKNMKVKNVPEAVAASIPATVISEDQSKYPKAPPNVIRRKVQKPAEIQEILETVIKQPCPGLNFVTEIQGVSGVQYYCSLCDSVCSSNSVTAHLTGFKHQLKSVKQLKPGAYEHMKNEPKYKIENELKSILRAVQRQEGMGRMAVEVEELQSMDKPYDPSQPPRDYRNIPSTSAGASTSRGISREQSGMSFTQRYSSSTVPDMSASDYFCEICQSHMNSLQMWEAHIRGKCHLIRGYTNGGGPSSQEEIIVPRPAVGVVIGKNGDMIKRIQQDSGARVQFIQGKEDIPGDKLCQITGTIDQVQKASSLIRDLIQSVMVRDQQMGGGGGGAPGGNMGMAGPGRGRGRGRGGMGGGPGIRPDFGPGGPRMGRPGGNEGGTEVQFAVPANKCGLVIGKGGETVRNINQQSGAHVEIARGAPPNPHEKIFIIRGNPQQIEHAKQLIMERVGGMPPGEGGPPGGHNMPGGPQGQYPGPPQYQQQ